MPRLNRSLYRLLLLINFFLLGDVLAESKGVSHNDFSIGESFGVQVKEWDTSVDELDAIKNAGFGLLRYGIGWPYVEDSAGQYNWAKYDTFIAEVRARGLRSIIILIGSHPSYSSETNTIGRDNRITPAPANEASVAGFARFAAAAAQRYQGGDITWELWNEPDLNRFWPPAARPLAYAKMARAACVAIRKANSSAIVIGPAAAGMPGWKDRLGIGWIAAVLQSPLTTCLDGISFHSYRIESNAPPKTPESVMVDNASAASFVTRLRSKDQPELPLICSEWGYNSLELSEEQQASYVLRTHLSNLLSGVSITVWYEWRDSLDDSSDPEAHYGLTDYRRKDKLAIRSVRNVLPLIRNYRIEERLLTPDQRDYVLVLRNSEARKRLVFWTTRPDAERPAYLRVQGEDKSVRLTSLPATAALPSVQAQISVVSDPQ